jgi:hypothetical protein
MRHYRKRAPLQWKAPHIIDFTTTVPASQTRYPGTDTTTVPHHHQPPPPQLRYRQTLFEAIQTLLLYPYNSPLEPEIFDHVVVFQ